ncbi:MAG: HNH endonuclease [Myxococcota bacterium]|nr:HNH endonuclease [Myxococcota bacterium]
MCPWRGSPPSSIDEADRRARIAAFRFLEQAVLVHGDTLPDRLLRQGFEFEGQRVPLVSPQGIFKPAILPDMPLTIRTAPVVEGKRRPYEDEVGADGFLIYRYRGTDPQHPDNVGLRRAMQRQAPLIYLYGIVPGWYRPVWPVYVQHDDPVSLAFHVAVDDLTVRPETTDADATASLAADTGSEVRRRYITASTQLRLHQSAFRMRVLRAYRETCAICRLRHPELLEAAHIVPDRDPRGEPTVANGVSLCVLHHAAFDRHIVGIRPDYRIEIRTDILEETDGPMLKHGLQGFQGGEIHKPRRRELWPRRDFLEERFERFRKAG